ncbi:MAG: NTP transferase domain-containing protein [Azospirillum sp.]|nr:NTP transferase domain-containing protein [Azospirillum sp.]
MKFGTIALDDALGAILAHGVKCGGLSFRKGRVLGTDDLGALAAAGIGAVIAARLEPGDLGEDDAATRIATALGGAGVSVAAAFTGRVNLFATLPGLAVIDAARLDRLNRIDPAITVATVAAFVAVEPRQMVATVKIIPFAAPAAAVVAAEAVMAEAGPPVTVAGYRPLRIALIQTRLPGLSEKILDKTARVTCDRLNVLGAALDRELRCDHDTAGLAETLKGVGGADLILIAGASAIADRADVLPAAIERAGGNVVHFGMPVDPGNLLLLARLGGAPVLGLPGCARSPRLNGFDWVLQRLVAGLPVTAGEIMAMGVGGLLAEIPGRPAPRAGAPRQDSATHRRPRIAALVLAAGRSTRMGGPNKLLSPLDGIAMVARVVDAVLASSARPVVVVTGHQGEAVRAALAGRAVEFADNPQFAQGLSTSLKTGLAALPDDVDGVLVCLGDMPEVSAGVLDRLIAAYAPAEGRAICVPTFQGKRGNPVLWDRGFFGEIGALAGDVGARHLIGLHAEVVCEVAIDEAGVLADIDTPEALARLQDARRSF